jgi:uncharacterized membrane protein SpoIIM required for sporulation
MLPTFQFNRILLLGLIGVLSYFIGFFYDLPQIGHKELFIELRKNVNHWEIFIFLFFTNLKVGLLILLVGYITGGIASVIVFTWNSFSLGMLISGINSSFSNPSIIIEKQILPHAVTEILAFFIWTYLSFEGIPFIRKIVVNSEFAIELIPSPKLLIVPTGLLALSALIESFISFN